MGLRGERGDVPRLPDACFIGAMDVAEAMAPLRRASALHRLSTGGDGCGAPRSRLRHHGGLPAAKSGRVCVTARVVVSVIPVCGRLLDGAHGTHHNCGRGCVWWGFLEVTG